MKRYISFCLSLLLIPLAAFAEGCSPAYNFLNIPSSVTSYGQGGINISTVNDDVNNIDLNPALLGPEMEQAVGINYMHYVAGSNFAGARFANRVSDRSAWSIGLQYFGYGSMTATDETGAVLGDFSPKDLNVSAAYSHDITDRWRGGVALKFLYSSYEEYSAVTLATDLGINYYDAERDLSLSLVVANLGGQVKRFTDAYDRLPIDVRLGWTQSFGTFPVRFSITAWNLTRWSLPYYENGDGTEEPRLKDSFGSNLFRHLIFGLNFVPSDNFNISLGYNYKTRTDMSTYSRSFLSGLSIGAMLRVSKFGIGVAFAQPHSGANTIMFNITTSISDFIR